MNASDRNKLLEYCERELAAARGLVQSEGAAGKRIEKWDDVPQATALPYAKVEWLVEGIVPRGGLTVLAGESGVGKTWFALALARAVAQGGVFLGRQCPAHPVLYLDRENPAALIYQRLATLGVLSATPQGPLAAPALRGFRLWGGWCSDPPPLLGDPRLLTMAQAAQPLIIVDSLIRFHEMDENSASAMATVMGALRALCNAGSSLLVLHHKPKNSTSHYRGSSDIHAGGDVNFSLSRSREEGTLRLACFKNRHQPECTLHLRPQFANGGDYTVADEASETAAAAEQIREERSADAQQLFDVIGREPGLSQRQILERSSLPQKRAVSLLEEFAGKLWRLEQVGRSNCYYPFSEEASPTA